MDFTGVILKNDLLQWAESAGAKFHRAGHEWRSTCPIHKGNNQDAFAVWEEGGKQHWKCFTGDCGTGDVIDFVQKVNGCDRREAYRILGGEAQPDPREVARLAAERTEKAAQQLQAEIDRAQRALDELRRAQCWLAYHANLTDERRELWRERGIPDQWQDYWELGYCDTFAVGTSNGPYLSATLTIPIKDETMEVVNVRHRLLTPQRPNDKYRPDRPGLAAAPFLAYLKIGYDTNRILVVEGEIKSMVTFRALWNRNEEPIQVVGIPGKNQFRAIADRLQGHDVYILFDPDAAQQAHDAAREVGGKYITYPMKIDDAINAGAIDKAGIHRLLRMGRKAT